MRHLFTYIMIQTSPEAWSPSAMAWKHAKFLDSNDCRLLLPNQPRTRHPYTNLSFISLAISTSLYLY